MTTTSPAPPATAEPPSAAKVAVSGFVGTTIEWYDYLVFGSATVLVFNPLFFPELDPVAGTLAGFAAFAVAFLARPLGGLVFGHYGDRIGRKKMLVLSVLLMGGGTFAVGLLPTYDSIGIWAPVLLVLLRALQGFAVGGEWGGAVVMSLEHAPPHRRAFYASFPQAGVPAGLFLATGGFLLVTLLPDEQLLSWGWRLPFLFSAVLVVVALYIRLKVTESPEFEALRERGDVTKVPIAECLRTSKRALLAATLVMLVANPIFYLASVFFLSYGQTQLGLDRGLLLTALMVAAAVEVVTVPLFATLADRFGAKRFLLIGAAVVVVGCSPVFLLFDSGTTAGVIAAFLLALPFLHALVYGSVSGFTAELFPPRVRYTGSSVGYHLGSAITAAPVPIVATLLIARYDSSATLALYVIAAGLLGALVIWSAPRAHAPVEPMPVERVPPADGARRAVQH